MKIFFKKGFTLIELLVVIAVIGILATVILPALNGGRDRGKDASLKESILEFERLVLLEYDETGSYQALQPNVWFPYMSCDSYFTGNYQTQARNLCKDIVKNASCWQGSGCIFRFMAGFNPCCNNDARKNYSLMVPLSTGRMFCVGSSGKTPDAAGGSFDPGCWNNP